MFQPLLSGGRPERSGILPIYIEMLLFYMRIAYNHSGHAIQPLK